MITLLISLCALVLGYCLYGKFIEKVFSPDDRETPAISKADGLDFIALPNWKVFMIQFLNIAGTGPIFGAIMGAKFGPSCYLWIVLGCIFAGAVHDYLFGMLSERHGGAGVPEIIGEYLGNTARIFMLAFSVIMMLLVGAVFVYSPAAILGDIAGNGSRTAMMTWVLIVFVYYFIATFLPIDKIIAKIYPIFAFTLIFMALSLLVCLIIKWPSLPELWDGLGNRGPSVGLKGQPIFPCLFVTIACGAISGFHATQAPLMARCIKKEKYGRPIFYGSMIMEGAIALIWASISSYFFFDGGAAAVGSDISAAAPTIVTKVAESWLGVFGGILAILGVVAAPITSGDTALRSARLIIANAFHLDQRRVGQRLLVAVPIFVGTALLLWFNIADSNGFNTIWRYFGWANQTLSVFTLWALTVYLVRNRKGLYYLITLLPACFMSSVSLTYICIDKIGFNMPHAWIPYLGTGIFALCLMLFTWWKVKKG